MVLDYVPRIVFVPRERPQIRVYLRDDKGARKNNDTTVGVYYKVKK